MQATTILPGTVVPIEFLGMENYENFDRLSMATPILPGTVVPEVLHGKENYENWSACIKNYLLAQDLWDIIETSMEPPKPEDDDREVKFKAWRKKNAATLHAIQISCGMNILPEIKGISSAKILWDKLAKAYEHPAQEGRVNLRLPAADENFRIRDNMNRTAGFSEYAELYEAVRKGDWDVASVFITQHPDSVRAKITHLGQTALHVAIIARSDEIAKPLVEEKMSKEDLEIRDNEGLTALAVAIICGFDLLTVDLMIRKNPDLLTVGNNRGGLDIPIVLALRHGQKELARFLFDVTPYEELTPEKGPHGATVVTQAIQSATYDLAEVLISHCPRLAFSLDTDNVSPLSLFVGLISLSGVEFHRTSSWKRIKLISSPRADIFGYYLDNRDQKKQEAAGITIRFAGPLDQHSNEIESIQRQFRRLLFAMLDSIEISAMNEYQIGIESGVAQAIFSAVRAGVVGFVTLIAQGEQRELLYWVRDGKGRNVLMSAVQHRHAEIFGMIYGLRETKARLLSSRDNVGNNILHVAGTLTEVSPLDHITGAALKMQSEVQWFKGVENLCNPLYRNEKNYAGLTPKQVFMQSHKKLIEEGERWMRETASSCTVVGTLIMTIMFAAAFTIPGGNNQDTGLLIFLNRKLFDIFIIADSLSLFSSSVSVLMFLGILTSRYEAEYFLNSLPTKMIIGLFTLFFSIGTMMIAFSSAILIMYCGESWIVIPLIVLASVPISLYVFMHFGLLVDMIVSTYGAGTFDRKMKSGVELSCIYK
ncbi:uncharacterized protein LOC122291610 [Carya illinoinensis]|uniref:PGG domain-containing protein n=1 Tax=Carya illinoinensis TaxID=32201 RepID=A0A8T1NGW9_CARIL|nr:uncharacterized protein LOC122291610 [Carya illinoinensis]KAG6630889.1 hypothetical protein CIPAW_13G052400 [Carya illinoinensis]